MLDTNKVKVDVLQYFEDIKNKKVNSKILIVYLNEEKISIMFDKIIEHYKPVLDNMNDLKFTFDVESLLIEFDWYVKIIKQEITDKYYAYTIKDINKDKVFLDSVKDVAADWIEDYYRDIELDVKDDFLNTKGKDIDLHLKLKVDKEDLIERAKEKHIECQIDEKIDDEMYVIGFIAEAVLNMKAPQIKNKMKR